MYAIRSYYASPVVLDVDAVRKERSDPSGASVEILKGVRITSYNVCYTKLLRPDELIFGLEQYFSLLRLGLFYRFLRYTRRLLLGGRKLKSGVQPADHPPQENTSKRKGYIKYSQWTVRAVFEFRSLLFCLFALETG